MKKGLLYSMVILAAIVIVSSFNMQLGNITDHNIPESMAGGVLYVCPMADSTWDSVAIAFRPFTNYIIAAFFFGLVLLIFGWGWQLYQNLIADKFKRESFKTVWALTKWGFWAAVIVTVILYTPNHLRRVAVTGSNDNWVLCDATTPGSTPVPADAVRSR